MTHRNPTKLRSGSVAIIATLAVHCLHPQPAVATTATFENLRGDFLGFGPFTDPLSGITFNNISNAGLGASYFNGGGGYPSLYQNNTVLVSNAPQSDGTIEWTNNFSIHCVLPIPANDIGADILFYYGTYISSPPTAGTVTLNGYNQSGGLVGSASTPVLGADGSQTALEMVFPSPVDSFSLIDSGLATDYDNISFSNVPEPSFDLAMAVLTLLLLASPRDRQMDHQYCWERNWR